MCLHGDERASCCFNAIASTFCTRWEYRRYMSHNGFKVEHRYLELPDSFYTRVPPTPLKDARIVCFNHALASESESESCSRL